jgi:hypothetical protein
MKPILEKAKLAHYFGLVIEVVCRMENYSVIRYRGRKVIIETADLAVIEKSKCAA